MKSKVACVLLLSCLVFVMCLAQDDDDECTQVDFLEFSQDLDATKADGKRGFDTSIGISEDTFAKNIDAVPDKDAAAVAAGKEFIELQKDLARETQKLEKSQTVGILQHYYRTCPYKNYWFSPYVWIFDVSTKKSRKYCWALHSIHTTICQSKYCHIKYQWYYWSYFHYRCIEERVPIVYWARCVEITQGNPDTPPTVTWSYEYRKLTVNRGCCCRRYWKIPGAIADDKTCTAR